MLQVKDYIGANTTGLCSKCGKPVYGDNGYLLTNGTYVCVAGDKCSMRVTSKASENKPKRWRK